jgi:hypothetical protein
MAPAQGEIIDAKHRWSTRCGERQEAYESEERRPTDWDTATAGESCPMTTTQGEANVPERFVQWHTAPGITRDQPGYLFREGPPCARGIATTEPPNPEVDGHPVSTNRLIGDLANVA